MKKVHPIVIGTGGESRLEILIPTFLIVRKVAKEVLLNVLSSPINRDVPLYKKIVKTFFNVLFLSQEKNEKKHALAK